MHLSVRLCSNNKGICDINSMQKLILYIYIYVAFNTSDHWLYVRIINVCISCRPRDGACVELARRIHILLQGSEILIY